MVKLSFTKKKWLLSCSYNPHKNNIGSNFLNIYSLKNLVSQKTCFKIPENPSYIDRIFRNCLRSFQNTGVFETGLSDFHKLTFTVLKQYILNKNLKWSFTESKKISLVIYLEANLRMSYLIMIHMIWSMTFFEEHSLRS